MKQPPRIAHILPWPAVGGTEHATLRVARAAAPDFESILYCRDDAPEVREFCAAAGFPTASWTAVQPSYRYPVPYLRAALRLAGDIRRRGISLLHCSDVLAAHFTALAGRIAGIPVIAHIRNRQDVIARRDQTFLYPVNRFVFVSKDTWRQFGYSVPASRGCVLYDGFDISDPGDEPAEEVRARFGLGDRAKVIGMAARVAPQKDYRTLIQAAVQVVQSEPDARFLVIGDYERAAEHREHYVQVREWLREAEMEPYFVFAGYQTDVPRLLRALDVFVLSTNWEGLPLVILEAMACGRPVVATDVDGISEIVRDGVTGLLSAPRDSAALAANLLQVLRDPDRASSMGAAGQQRVELEFSGQRFAADVKSLYRDMLHLKRE